MTSSIGVRLSAWPAAYQDGIDRMSCPALACASAAMVSRILSPLEVMKSIDRSTFSLAAQSMHSLRIGSLADGTQWSQKPHTSLPPAGAPGAGGAGEGGAGADPGGPARKKAA